MFTNKEKEIAEGFLNVLRTEVLRFFKDLSWTIESDNINIKCSNGYIAEVKIINKKIFMINQYNEFSEKDFLDGMVRLRFELIKDLNPKAFI